MSLQNIESLLNKYQLIFNCVNDYIVIHDLKGNILEINDTAERILGYSKREMLSMNINELEVFNHQKTSIDLEDIKKTRKLIKQIQVRKRNGEVFPAEISAILFNFNGKNSVLTIVRDISERKNTQKQVDHYKMLVENVNDAIISTDTNFNITSWNRAAELMYGWKEEEVKGLRVRNVIPTLPIGYTEEEARAELVDKGTWNGDSIQIRKDGEEVYVNSSVRMIKDQNGQVQGAVAINKDITRYIEMENELKGRIKEIKCLYGISRLSEVSNISIQEILKGTLGLISPAMDDPSMVCVRIILGDLEYRTDNFQDPQSSNSCSINVGDDLLELEFGYLEGHKFSEWEKSLCKDIVARLQSIIEKKRTSQRMKDLITTISHDIRTPITVLSLSMDYIEKKREDIEGEVLNELIESGRRNVELLQRLADKIAKVSKQNSSLLQRED